MAEYTPAGRPSAFTLPDGGDSADLITILQDFANDTMNVHGDTVTGDFTITGTVDASGLEKGGVPVATTTGTETLSGKTYQGLGAIQVCTSSTRPGTPAEGQFIYETDTNLVYFYTGAAWSEFAPGGGGGGPHPFLLMGA